MDSSLPHTLTSQDLLTQTSTPQATVGTENLTSGVVSPSSQPAASTSDPPQNAGDPASTSTAPVKRKVGRPKGSTNKTNPVAAAGKAADLSNKIKRPVGRPRKDGLPAGSVTSSTSTGRPGRPRKSAPAGSGEGGSASAAQLGPSISAGFPVPQPGVRASILLYLFSVFTRHCSQRSIHITLQFFRQGRLLFKPHFQLPRHCPQYLRHRPDPPISRLRSHATPSNQTRVLILILPSNVKIGLSFHGPSPMSFCKHLRIRLPLQIRFLLPAPALKGLSNPILSL